MSPLRAIVVDRANSQLTMRTKQGVRFTIPEQKGLKLGDNCYVLYDFTKMKIARIWTESDLEEDDAGEELDFIYPDECDEEDFITPDEDFGPFCCFS
jgi:hypothetical protein